MPYATPEQYIEFKVWEVETVRDPDDVIVLESVHCDLPVAEIYSGLEMLDTPVA